MQINISNLSEGLHPYELTADAGVIGLEAHFRGTVTARVSLVKSMDQIHATVDAAVTGRFVCDRCAEEFERSVTARFVSVYAWEPGETSDEEDDFHVLRPDQNIIDIAPGVREYLTLAVPLKLECGRAECEIPAVPERSDEAADPRWEGLKRLLKKEEH
ncbi:MAG: DUF177 domain-containing protein [Bacteroidetes bacterium]|nr:MAG: DUF177 domain-containing protein [Bacteroidota bacterium]